MLAIKFKTLSSNLKKFILSLKDKKKRKETGLFIAEGYKLCEELFQSNYPTELVVLDTSAKEISKKLAQKFFSRGVDVYVARRQQFIQLCETETPQDIIAIAKSDSNPKQIEYPIVLLDGISDPGNFGTIIRTADWFGVKTLVTSPDSVEKYNPKVIRGSMGAFFRVNVLQKENLANFIVENQRDTRIFAATLDANRLLSQIKLPKNSMLIFGNEARGISPEILKLCDEMFKIEGEGNIDSLNLGISVGIVLYKYYLDNK